MWEPAESGAFYLVVNVVVFFATLAVVSHYGGRLWTGWRSRLADRVIRLLPDDVGYHAGPGAARAIEVHGGDPSLALLPRSEAPGLEFRSGDPAFDAAVRVIGWAPALHALLDAPTRTHVLALMRPWGQVEYGSVRARLATDTAAHVAERIATARAVAAALEPIPAGELPERLTRIALEDPVGRVRLLALRAFADLEPTPDRTALAARLIHDPDAFVRIEATTLTNPPAAAQLHGLRRHESPAVRKAAILATAALPDAVAALTAHLSRDGDAAPVAEALGRTGDPAAEPLLLVMLPDPDIFPIVVRALGATGTARAVEALHDRRRGPHAGLVTEAIARIRSRLGDVDGGRLSLAAADGGELSMAAQGGELAVVGARDVPPG